MTEPRALGTFSAEKQKLLQLLLREKGVRTPRQETIPRRPPGAPPAPLSFSQQRLWVLDRLAPGSPLYNAPAAVRLTGRLDAAVLFAAVNEVVRRHEALRTTIREVDGQAVQIVSPEPEVERGVVDLASLPEAARETELLRAAGAVAALPFDLEQGPLTRTVLVRLGEADHVFVLVLHHIVSDGWSCGVFVREMTTLYEAFARGLPSPLPDLPLQYADFAAWQRARLSGETLEAELCWWREQLAGFPSESALPTDRPRPAVPSYRGAWREGFLDPGLEAGLRELCRREDATLFMAAFAGFAALLGRLSGQTDVVIGTPIANRNRAEIEGLIGFFANTLALRADLAGDPGFREILARVRRTAHGAYEHQELPFERLVEELRPEREAGRNPIFQVIFALQNTPIPALELPGLVVAPLDVNSGTAKFDLSLFLAETEAGLGAGLEYAGELFDAPTVDRLLGHFGVLLTAAVADPDRPLPDLPLLTPPELHQLQAEWNDSETSCERGRTVPELFAEQAARTPDAEAIVFGDDRLTYAQLRDRADQLARHLRALGVGPEDLVGLALDRSADLVVSMLAVLTAGAAYLPLDPSQPEERRARMLEEAEVRVVLGEYQERLALSSLRSETAGSFGADGLAYVLYTSGSTGRPKGVAVPHRGIVRLVRRAGYVELGPGDRVAQASNASFDAATFEVWGALLNGACLVGVPREVSLAPRELAAFLRRERIGVLFLTTALFHQIALEEPTAFGAVRFLLVGGEALDPRRAAEVLGAGGPERLLNGYGPTETTTFATWQRIDRVPEGARSVPIGLPIPWTRVHLLDRGFAPVPIGVPGEVLIGGDGLARGYLRQPALTAERFVPDPLGPAGGRLYRTGDLARRRPDGAIEFLGRLDAQVKVRGFRIEPGEIEAALAEHPGVAQAVVVPREEEGSRSLVACVVPADGVPPAASDLRAFLRERLPEYMVPAGFMTLDELPLTHNGKVDRRALARRAAEGKREGSAPERGPAPPRGPVEEVLAGIWADVLGVERVDAQDGFFDLGGHSLLAMSALSRVRVAFGIDLPLRALFEEPTVEGLARRIDEERRRGALAAAPPIRPVSRELPLPLSFSQERLWLVDRLQPGTPLYNIPAAARLRGSLSVPALEAALGALVERHEALRTRYDLTADGLPVQIVDPPAGVPAPVADLQGLPEETRETEVERLAWEESVRSFDLQRGPVLRALLLRLGPEEHVGVLTRHHIVSDGWSQEIFARELAALYAAALAGRSSALPPLPVQYADYAVWQREHLGGTALDLQLDWWRERLAGAPPLLQLPADRPRPPVQSFLGEIRAVSWSGFFVEALRDLARYEGATLFLVLLTAFDVLVQRLTGRDDVIVGSPVANRPRPELEGLIGFFANTLVLRTDLGGAPTFREVLGRVRETALGAWDHQDLPFERLVEELRPRRDPSHTPVFQVMFVHQPPVSAREDAALPELAALRTEPLAGTKAVSRYDLEVYALEERDGLTLALEYSSALFDAPRMLRLLGHLEVFLEAAMADPGQRLADLPLLTGPERHQLLTEWLAGPPVPEGEESLLHELFEAQVARTPEAVAVIAGEERWTYRELNERAEAIAYRLRGLGAGVEDRVGIRTSRTPWMVASLLGILKAGGAYVPLDPGYPQARIERIVADARPKLVLGDVDEALRFSSLPHRTHEAPPLPGLLAYLIYTSGSTGEPKGVAISHANAVALVRWAWEVFPPEDLAGVLASTSINFDLSVFELFVSLSRGGTVILAENALELPRLPAAERVTLINTVPSAMAELVRAEAVPPSVRTINLAGEPLTRGLAERVLALPGRPRLLNLYGPSEDTTYSTWARVEAGSPTIGRPVAGTRALVLDRELRPLPIGVPGELVLGGVGLARGYFGRPEATAERWVPDTFGGFGERLYRTGDLGRYRADGELEILGRTDHQVKVRGFRIELGEIEAALMTCPGVREAAVLALSDGEGRRLVAWVVGEGDDELRGLLRERLPEPMIPSAFVLVPALPRTPTGKVDRAALATRVPALPEPRISGETAGPIEDLLAEMWAEVLGIERVGVHDDFFDLGGHSLLATRLVARLRQTLGVELPVRSLFEAPTVAAQARAVRAAGAATAPPLRPAPRTGDPPLSSAQERMWFLERLDPGAAYHIPAALRLAGGLDIPALERALREIVRRHEALRTSFPAVAGLPVQRIAADPVVSFLVVDLGALQPAAAEVELRCIAAGHARAPFDLLRGPLLRAALVRVAADDHVLLATLHHIVSDGWSLGVLVRELSALYNGTPLPDLPVQYADFACWQRGWLDGGALEDGLGWWREQLAGELPVLDLPGDRLRPAAPSFRGGELRQTLPGELTARLRRLGREAGASLFMTLLAGFQALLLRHTGQRDLIVGTPIAGRDRAEVEGLIGLFVNTLALRVEIPEGTGLAGLAARVREAALGAYAHQHVPFERLVEDLQPQRSLGHSPLFQVFFALQNAPLPALDLPGLALRPVDVEVEIAPFDLTVSTTETAEGLALSWIYARDLFDRTTVMRFADRFAALLAAAAAEPERPIEEIPLLAEPERHALLVEWNDSRIDLPADLCIHRIFAARMALQPDAVAIEDAQGSLTYGELDWRADRLARDLHAHGAGPEARVALCAERSLDLVTGMLAILKAGGAYVPLDPEYPEPRLAFLLDDARPLALLAQSHLTARLPKRLPILLLDQHRATLGRDLALLPLAPERQVLDPERLPFDRERPALDPEQDVLDRERLTLDPEQPALDPEWRVLDPERRGAAGGDRLACVFYTSGSTGRPKGVAVTHRGVCRLTLGPGLLEIRPSDVMAQVSNASFDAATLEIWGALLNGARLVILPRDEILAPAGLAAAVLERQITSMHLTSAWYRRVATDLPGAFTPLRSLCVGGEAVDPVAFARVMEAGLRQQLLHAYGPTEVTTLTSVHRVRSVPAGVAALPVGRPIANTRMLVLGGLDGGLQPAPLGVPGELYAAGDGLARGYLGRPDLTAERFVPDPFGEPGGRLYATGDRARWLPSGEVEILGRRDRQVKIRGIRIEPGEIEAALAEHPAVAAAAVLVREDVPGERRLVAFVAAPGTDPASLRDFLRGRLPEPLVPTAFVMLPELPIDPNGKVDRATLAQIGPAPVASGASPRTPAEELLAGIWEDLLNAERVGPGDSFFDLGGHSLLASRLASRVREAFGVELPLRAVFEEPTLGTLAARIEELARSGAPAAPPLVLRPDRGEAPLSFGQQRLWFLDRLHPGSAAYNIPVALRISGDLDAAALARSLEEIQRRHEVLRTTFGERDGEPVQVVAPEPLARVDLRMLPEAQARRWIEDDASRPFDLARGPLLRAVLFELEEGDHILGLNLHHAIADGWSAGVLIRELAALYEGRPLPELPIQYGDYARWQRDWLQGEALAAEVAWWRQQLDGAPAALELPTDRPRREEGSGRAGTVSFTLSEDLSARLRTLARREAVTPFMLLLTGFGALLARHAGQDDLCVGTPIAGRNRLETEGLIGLFVNLLALRLDLTGDPQAGEALRRVREAALEAFAHPDIPFEKLVEELEPERSLARAPIFQVSFALQNLPVEEIRLPGIILTPLPVESGEAKLDLSLAMVEEGERFAGTLAWAADLFDRTTVQRLLACFERLLGEIAAGSERRISDLEVLGEAERHQLLVEWNPPGNGEPRSLYELFERQADLRPETVAVVFEGERWTYGDLERRANRIAWRLRRLGIGRGERVAIVAGRSAERIAWMLGIWKAGAAWVALDPESPPARLAQILEDAAPRQVLAETRFLGLLPSSATVLVPDALADEPEERPSPLAGPLDAAYVTYTSGSTGRPKGILAHHGGAADYLCRVLETYGITAEDVALQRAPFTFDASLRDTFGPLAAGARLVVVPDEAARDPEALRDLMTDEGVTCLLSVVPSLLRQLTTVSWQRSRVRVRLILSSGETLHGEDAAAVRRTFGDGARLVNQYGASEATMSSAWHPVSREDEAAPSISAGRPLTGIRTYLLDPGFRPVPLGVLGEVCLGGSGLAWGYLGQPDRTAESFVPDPFDAPGERLYRTGDLARRRADGLLELLGRRDTQVKIRGLRVEPGEVEAVLRGHAAVRDATVIAREDRLVAYVVGDAGPEELRAYLVERLPSWLVPSAWVSLDTLPLTPHGKVDHGRLPEPSRERMGGGPLVAPRDGLELELVRIWEEVLGVHPIGVTDGFFDLGGHSMIAVRLMAAIRSQLGRDLPLSALFRGGTVESLATLLREGGPDRPASPLVTLTPARPGSAEPPLFCIHGAGGEVLVFADLARTLGEDRPLYALEARGLDRIEAMADLYLAAVRSAQPQGPYHLFGYSMGGKVAFEMARRLEAAGEEVGLLAIADVPARPSPEERSPDSSLRSLPSFVSLPAGRHYHANREASRRYVPGPYGGRVVLFVAEEGNGAGATDPTLGWAAYAAGGVEVIRLPADHFNLLAPPHVQRLAELLRTTAYIASSADGP